MSARKSLFPIVVALGLAGPGLVMAPVVRAADDGMFIRTESHQSFGDTVSAFKRAVPKKSMMVMGNVSQASVLNLTGSEFEGGESFLVGNPTVAKGLFAINPAVGAVLPVRVYIWEADGKTWLGYFKPSTLLSAIDAELATSGAVLDKHLHAVIQDTVKE